MKVVIFNTWSVIVFYLVCLNCNIFHVQKFLDVASGGRKTDVNCLARFFSALVLRIKISVLHGLCILCVLEVEKNHLYLCSEPAGSCVNVSSILPREDLSAWMWYLTP